MKERILNVMSHMPSGGMALHGTSLQNALQIAEKGLKFPGYVTLVPNPNDSFFRYYWDNHHLLDRFSYPKMDHSEFYSRTIGSILYAMGHSFKHRTHQAQINAEVNAEPAMVIFARWEGDKFNLVWDDLWIPHVRVTPSGYSRPYFSFGVMNFRSGPNEVCAIAKLGQDEISKIEAQARTLVSGDSIAYSFNYSHLVCDALILKTLQLIEQLTFLENKPDKILFL